MLKEYDDLHCSARTAKEKHCPTIQFVGPEQNLGRFLKQKNIFFVLKNKLDFHVVVRAFPICIC